MRTAIFAVVMLGALVWTHRVARAPGTVTEAGALRSMRALISGESTYASSSGGVYDTLECLAQPNCLPGATPFLSPGIGMTSGYRFQFFPGPKPDLDKTKALSRSAMTRYAYIAVPLQRGPQTTRAFCGDDRERIYITLDGTPPDVRDGRCVDTSHPIQ